MEAKVKRDVSVCLVGVGHDDVEERFRKKFRRVRKPNELVFWEDMAQNESEHNHHGYEDYAAFSIEFINSALALRILHDKRIYNSHEKFEPWTMERDSNIFKHKPQRFEIYNKYTLEEKMIVHLFFQFWLGLCTNQGQDSIFITLLSENEKVLKEWQAMIEKVEKTTEHSGCWMLLKANTLSIVNTFLDEFTRLLIDNRDHIPDFLRNTALILYRMNNDDPRLWFIDWNLANLKMRDQLNVKYILNLLEKNQNIDRVILIVGATHVRSLHQYIDEYNVLTNRSDERMTIYYNNIIEIIPAYLRSGRGVGFYPLPNNVIGVRPQIHSMSSDVIDAYVKDMMTRIIKWRSSIRINPIGFEVESSSDEEEEVKTTKTKRSDEDKKRTKKTRFKSMCLSCSSTALVHELGNPEHTFCDAMCQEKFYLLQ